MRPKTLLVSLLVPFSTAQTTAPPLLGAYGNTTVAGNGSAAASDGKYTIAAEGIRAKFVPYGASISNLFINDSHGIERDIVLGWDNASYYTEDKKHPHFGAVPGRYANRIKNSTFTIAGETSHITPNENNGKDSLHGGLRGWDWRNWTVTAHTTDSITFSLVDPDGDQGFPGEVISYVTYTLTAFQWHIRMVAIPTTKVTPIMLSSHTYWNLDGFQNPDTPTILNHTLNLPYSGQRLGVDGILIPTGDVQGIQEGSFFDFWSQPKQIGANFSNPGLDGSNGCGTGCTGYDTCFLVNRGAYGQYDWRTTGPVAVLFSAFSGIKVSVYSDQDAFQIYSCASQNDTTTLKSTQGFKTPSGGSDTGDAGDFGTGRGSGVGNRTIAKYGCVVMEVEDWIDGINQPQWGRADKQIYGPGGDPYVLQALYDFSIGDAGQAQNLGYGGMKKHKI